ncbi:putative interferon-induced protein 44-like [Triplophysa rosa]|uniref:Interferon-induced protein 44-like n=1 Tax=Triplophysa rosa TaxID=992332 RepID=A0A9W8C8K9_TRIRA|nr:putative interferon-induced protein 44-like [Triplophysa rosa]
MQNSHLNLTHLGEAHPGDKEKDYLEKNLRDFRLNHPNVEYVRILLIGDVGAGKSSFINSINSAFQKRITTEALANSTSSDSFTKTYRTYYIRSGESILPFVFNDVMGLESQESKGAHPEDIVKALQGFMKHMTYISVFLSFISQFNPASAVSVDGEGYQSDPTLQEQSYCLVYVMAADKVPFMNTDVIRKMQNVRTKASELASWLKLNVFVSREVSRHFRQHLTSASLAL